MANLKTSRRRSFEDQCARCTYCAALMWLDHPEEFAARFGVRPRAVRNFMATAEHLTARSDGGGNDPRNIEAACWTCNHRRHARKGHSPTLHQYRSRVRKLNARGTWHPSWAYDVGIASRHQPSPMHALMPHASAVGEVT
ncbi:HNH endonuclease [Lysobacter sp. MMG2]|nr:HNH endonuclease [Lysobacter sp. MMG2]